MEVKILHRLIRNSSLTGLIELDSGTYLFRNDHAHKKGIWAWNIRDDYDKGMVHKWQGLPNKHVVHLFNLDNPPETVPYQPLLG